MTQGFGEASSPPTLMADVSPADQLPDPGADVLHPLEEVAFQDMVVNGETFKEYMIRRIGQDRFDSLRDVPQGALRALQDE